MARGLTPVTGVTRREAVLIELRNAILTGHLSPGERLPEAQLSNDLGVSRSTVREAIYQLIHEGLLVHEDYKGVTVATIDESTINDIAVVRVALESLAAKTIAADKNGAARARLRAAWEAYDEAAGSGDPAFENEAHLELHRTIWIESGNVILQQAWPIIAASINLALSTDAIIRHDEERNRRLHRELVAVILDNRQREVITAVREHIQTSAAELLGLCTPGSIGTGGSAIRPATGNGRARGGRSRSA